MLYDLVISAYTSPERFKYIDGQLYAVDDYDEPIGVVGKGGEVTYFEDMEPEELPEVKPKRKRKKARKKPKPKDHAILSRRTDRGKPLEGLRSDLADTPDSAYAVAMDKWRFMLRQNQERKISDASVIVYSERAESIPVPSKAARDPVAWKAFEESVAKARGISTRKVRKALRNDYEHPGRAVLTFGRDRFKTVRVPPDALDSPEAFKRWLKENE